MEIKDILEEEKSAVPARFTNETLVQDTEDWKHLEALRLNGPIAMGWCSNDDIFVINNEGTFLYSIRSREMIYEDYSTNIQKNISKDNLSYFLPQRNERISIFGLRGGDGNRLTSNSEWALGTLNLDWTLKVPELWNYKKNQKWYLLLPFSSYQGYLYAGFSPSETYFAVMRDEGIALFSKV